MSNETEMIYRLLMASPNLKRAFEIWATEPTMIRRLDNFTSQESTVLIGFHLVEPAHVPGTWKLTPLGQTLAVKVAHAKLHPSEDDLFNQLISDLRIIYLLIWWHNNRLSYHTLEPLTENARRLLIDNRIVRTGEDDKQWALTIGGWTMVCRVFAWAVETGRAAHSHETRQKPAPLPDDIPLPPDFMAATPIMRGDTLLKPMLPKSDDQVKAEYRLGFLDGQQDHEDRIGWRMPDYFEQTDAPYWEGYKDGYFDRGLDD